LKVLSGTTLLYPEALSPRLLIEDVDTRFSPAPVVSTSSEPAFLESSPRFSFFFKILPRSALPLSDAHSSRISAAYSNASFLLYSLPSLNKRSSLLLAFFDSFDLTAEQKNPKFDFEFNCFGAPAILFSPCFFWHTCLCFRSIVCLGPLAACFSSRDSTSRPAYITLGHSPLNHAPPLILSASQPSFLLSIFSQLPCTSSMTSNPFHLLAVKDPDDGSASKIPPTQPFRTAPAHCSPVNSGALETPAPRNSRTPALYADALQARTRAIAADIVPSADSISIEGSRCSTIKITPTNPAESPAIEHSDSTLLAVASAFAYQKHFASVRALMLPANGLSFHFQKIKDYPESGFFFQCAFKPHPAALSSLREIDWHATLNSCPSFVFSCPARDKKTRAYKQVHVRIEIISSPLLDSSSSAPNPIQCFILFNPVLLSNPISQICQALESIDLAYCPLADYISIPSPLTGKHASAHTKQIMIKIPLSSVAKRNEQILYNLVFVHFKGLSSLANDASTLDANLQSLTLRLPMITDFLARRALSPQLHDYFLQLLDSEEFAHIPRNKTRIDRRGLFHEGTSAATSANESETEGSLKPFSAAPPSDLPLNFEEASTATASAAATPAASADTETAAAASRKAAAELTARQKAVLLKQKPAGGTPAPPMKP
jgi:hypothetical protein